MQALLSLPSAHLRCAWSRDAVGSARRGGGWEEPVREEEGGMSSDGGRGQPGPGALEPVRRYQQVTLLIPSGEGNTRKINRT